MAAKSDKLPILTSAWTRFYNAVASWLPAYSARLRAVRSKASATGSVPSRYV